MVIRAEQNKALEQVARRAFETEMTAHSRQFAPELSQILGEDSLRAIVRSAIARAEQAGFTNRGPIRLYLETMFLCGSAFDTDPQYPALGQALRSDADQMLRADQIYEGILHYLETVSGPGAIHVQQALSDLLHFARRPVLFPSGADFTPGMLAAMHRIFPLKAAYVGEQGLRALVEQALLEADQLSFDQPRQRALLVVLKFAFGHGCTHDPLYPWIERTLADPRITDPGRRAARLERKAITWLDHVVSENERRRGHE